MLPFDIPTLTADELIVREMEGTLQGAFYVSNEDYHAGPGLSSTDIKTVLRSPAHFRAKQAGLLVVESEAFAFGSGAHEALCEQTPGDFERNVVVIPSFEEYGHYNAAAHKEAKALWLAQNQSKVVVKPDEYERILELRRVAGGLSTWKKLTADALFELAVYAVDPATGLLLKSKADVAQDDTITDLKTTLDASPREFRWTVRKLGYHLSASFYLHVFNLALGGFDKFIWAVFEKKPPFAAAFYVASEAMLAEGKAAYEGALRTVAACQAARQWPSFPDRVEMLDEFL